MIINHHSLLYHYFRIFPEAPHPVTAEQEPQRLQLTDVHRRGLEAVAEVSGKLSAYAVLGLLVSGSQQEEFSPCTSSSVRQGRGGGAAAAYPGERASCSRSVLSRSWFRTASSSISGHS